MKMILVPRILSCFHDTKFFPGLSMETGSENKTRKDIIGTI